MFYMGRGKLISISIGICIIIAGFLVIGIAIDIFMKTLEHSESRDILEQFFESSLIVLVGVVILLAGIALVYYFRKK